MAQGAELNIESPWDREDAAGWILLTSGDKKWRMPVRSPNRQGFPVKTFGTPGGKDPTGKNRMFKRTGNNQMQFRNLMLVTPPSQLIGWTQTLPFLHFLLQKSQAFPVAGSVRNP
jgi:hypothetical protein